MSASSLKLPVPAQGSVVVCKKDTKEIATVVARTLLGRLIYNHCDTYFQVVLDTITSYHRVVLICNLHSPQDYNKCQVASSQKLPVLAQGSIVVRKKDTQEIAAYHSIAHIKIVSSFNPNCFIWSQASMERKLDETFRLRSVVVGDWGEGGGTGQVLGREHTQVKSWVGV